MATAKANIKTNHRFLDEAGDTAFYGKGKKAIIGTEGVSGCFILGMVKFREPLDPLRQKIFELQTSIAKILTTRCHPYLKRNKGQAIIFMLQTTYRKFEKPFLI